MRPFLLLTLWLAFSSAPGRAIAASPVPTEARKPPRFVVNLLDYVAADYGGAIGMRGEILSRSEYAEQKEFLEEARRAARALPELRDSAASMRGIEDLIQMIESRATPESVARQAQAAKRAVIEATGLAVAPSERPDLARGHELFTARCALCHGPGGQGDGPAGKGLDPRPADFTAARMSGTSPFREFNVIRVGVPGTAMVGFDALTDAEAWDLAFFVSALRFGGMPKAVVPSKPPSLLEQATLTDPELLARIPAAEGLAADEKTALLAGLRRGLSFAQDAESQREDHLALALSALSLAEDSYPPSGGDAGSRDSTARAKSEALRAYLDGVEPVEPRLRANDPEFTAELEEKMLNVRAAIDSGSPREEVSAKITVAREALTKARRLLADGPASPWLVFLIAAGILLREGFEAVLVLIALLAVVQVAGREEGGRPSLAARYVHGGWMAALGLGVVAWFLSGWLMRLSGAGREWLEATVSLLAVVVLLYLGFWLHSRTEIHRWKAFIDGQVRGALSSGNLWGLAGISFMAVFREAFEVVLFLRALWLQGGPGTGAALLAGVLGSLAAILVGSRWLLKRSARVPVRKIFAISSGLMILLALILAGKGVHSLQEVGSLGSTMVPGFSLPRFELFGIFPTRETLLAQAIALVLASALWWLGTRPPGRLRGRAPEAEAEV